MKTFKYTWNSFTGAELEASLNDLGARGWRLVHMEWDESQEQWLCIFEKEVEA